MPGTFENTGSWYKRSFKLEPGGILLWRSHCALLGWPQTTPGNTSEAAMAISAMHLVYLVQSSANGEAKTLTTLRGRVQNPAPNRSSNRIQCKACPAAALQSQQLQPRSGEVVWAQPKAGRCWWESAKRGDRASDTSLRDSVCVGPVGTASLLLKRGPSRSPRQEQHCRQGSIPQHTHHPPTPTLSSKHLGLHRTTPWPVIVSLSKGSCRLINVLLRESGGDLLQPFNFRLSNLLLWFPRSWTMDVLSLAQTSCKVFLPGAMGGQGESNLNPTKMEHANEDTDRTGHHHWVLQREFT